MKDGLYRVITKHFVVGFVIEHGELTACAPILRKNFLFWKTVATRISI